MYNIYDYINYYKNYSFEDIHFNIMDALIYSMIIYVPVNTLNDGSNFEEMLTAINVDINGENMKSKSFEMLKLISQSERYKNIKIYNFIKQEDDRMQFGAMTIRNGNDTFVAFQGTNGSIIGWKENFNLSCEYPTITQIEAKKYLNNTIRTSDKNIFIGGHSKGGNLAMAAGMECYKYIFNRIKRIYNFDGPGFRKGEFENEKFKMMSPKLTNILPDGSLVGILLNNSNYNFVKSSGIGAEKHYPTNWYVFGEFFVPNSISEYSKTIHESINKSVEQLDANDMKTLLNIVFDFLKTNNIQTIKDLQKLKLGDLKNMVGQIREVDDKTKKLFFDITRILINPSSERMGNLYDESDDIRP